jgi:hypothetical protein
MPNLPADLRQALSDHLNKQLNQVNILKPEYCRRLYPILVELADLNTFPEIPAAVLKGGVAAPNGMNEPFASDSIFEDGEDAEI